MKIFEGLIPCIEFYIFKRDENNRVFALMIAVFFSAAPDKLVFEIDGSILVGLFKKGAEHIHIQRFAETPGAGKQRDDRKLIQKVSYHQCLIDIVIFRLGQAIIGNPNGQRKVIRCFIFDIRTGFYALIGRFFCICRNKPDMAILFCAVFDYPYNYIIVRKEISQQNCGIISY